MKPITRGDALASGTHIADFTAVDSTTCVNETAASTHPTLGLTNRILVDTRHSAHDMPHQGNRASINTLPEVHFRKAYACIFT